MYRATQNALAFAVAALAAAPVTAAPKQWPDAVEAAYKITYLGVEVGEFRFKSKVSGDRYEIESNSKLKVLLGAFKWRGSFEANGQVGRDGPTPGSYIYEYKSSKDGSVKIGFKEGRVDKIALDPPKKPSKSAIPLKDEHLRGVLDPLSAIMAISSMDGGKPCDRTFPLFDGKQRFDIGLKPQSSARAKVGDAISCRVTYKPIAGHKPNKENKSLAEGNIEVVMKPIASANIAVPQQITMPTAWGEAALIAKRIEVTTGGQKQIAFVDK